MIIEQHPTGGWVERGRRGCSLRQDPLGLPRTSPIIFGFRANSIYPKGRVSRSNSLNDALTTPLALRKKPW
jgi:hypothetical protein